MIKKNRDLSLRKINVADWDSPVAKQYGIRSLPSYKLYDSRGKLVADGKEAYKKVLAWKKGSASTNKAAPAGRGAAVITLTCAG